MNIQSSGKEGLSLATCHRDKLLEFDRTSVRRTKVIDDESDYFTTDSRSVSYCVARYMCMLMTSNSGHVFCLCLSAICYQLDISRYLIKHSFFNCVYRWISDEERKKLREKEEKYHEERHDRKTKKMTFDFAGRKIIEDEPSALGK